MPRAKKPEPELYAPQKPASLSSIVEQLRKLPPAEIAIIVRRLMECCGYTQLETVEIGNKIASAKREEWKGGFDGTRNSV